MKQKRRLTTAAFSLPSLDSNGTPLLPGLPTWVFDDDVHLKLQGSLPHPQGSFGDVIRVLIADPQRMVATAIGFALNQEPDIEVIDAFPDSGEATVAELMQHKPQILVADFRMQDMSGPELTTRTKKVRPDLKVILLSWFHGAADIESALDAGATGFFTKAMTVAQLADGIRRAQAGESPVYLNELEDLFERLSSRADDTARALRDLKSLSRRELQVLALLAVGKSVKEVAEELSLQVSTVKSYIRGMLRKTGSFSTQEVLKKARFGGLLRT